MAAVANDPSLFACVVHTVHSVSRFEHLVSTVALWRR